MLLALGRGGTVGGAVISGAEVLGKDAGGEDGYEDEWSKVEAKAVCLRLGCATDEPPVGTTAEG